VIKYDMNGANWDQVDARCGTGMEQSPINLYKWMTDADSNQKIEGFNFRNYGAGGLTIEKTPDTMKMDFSEGLLNLTLPPADENS
jgi:carbonic anhydrase